jgi:steroid delta-isomerase-like uncharacterized protein
MSKDNKAILRRYAEEIMNQGNLAVADELIALNVRDHFHGLPETAGREGFKQFVTTLRSAFPDAHFTIENIIDEGNIAAVYWTFRGTHKGDYMGISPTHKQVRVNATAFYQVAEGQIEALWGNLDNLGMMQQLGVAP